MLIREDLPQMLPGDNSLIQSPRREQPCYKKTINLIFLCMLLAYFGVKSVPFGQPSDFQYHTSN